MPGTRQRRKTSGHHFSGDSRWVAIPASVPAHHASTKAEAVRARREPTYHPRLTRSVGPRTDDLPVSAGSRNYHRKATQIYALTQCAGFHWRPFAVVNKGSHGVILQGVIGWFSGGLFGSGAPILFGNFPGLVKVIRTSRADLWLARRLGSLGHWPYRSFYRCLC